MAQNIKNEKIDNIIKEIIIPDLEKLLSKEYQTDAEILQALDELQTKWVVLDIPIEYDEAIDMLISDKYSKSDIYALLPFSHIYIYVVKLITYLFFQNSKFETELSLLSSLNQICIDKAGNKELTECIMEHIKYVQDIAMAKDKEKEDIIKSALKENATYFLKNF